VQCQDIEKIKPEKVQQGKHLFLCLVVSVIFIARHDFSRRGILLA